MPDLIVHRSMGGKVLARLPFDMPAKDVFQYALSGPDDWAYVRFWLPWKWMRYRKRARIMHEQKTGQFFNHLADMAKHASAEQKPAEWVEVSMPIKGREQNGVVRIEDMPGNPGYPNPWRVDGQLGVAPSHCILGPWSIPSGKSCVNRYRITVK